MSSAPRYVFKFKGKWPALIAVGLLLGLLTGLAVLIWHQEQAVSGVMFCLGFSIFLALLGSIFLRGRLDIVVDEQATAREMWGWRVQSIPWKDVDCIVVFPVRAAGASANVTAYSIRASREENGHVRTSKTFFNDQANDLSDLLATLNVFLARYQIKVEHVSNGTKVVSHSL